MWIFALKIGLWKKIAIDFWAFCHIIPIDFDSYAPRMLVQMIELRPKFRKNHISIQLIFTKKIVWIEGMHTRTHRTPREWDLKTNENITININNSNLKILIKILRRKIRDQTHKNQTQNEESQTKYHWQWWALLGTITFIPNGTKHWNPKHRCNIFNNKCGQNIQIFIWECLTNTIFSGALFKNCRWC